MNFLEKERKIDDYYYPYKNYDNNDTPHNSRLIPNKKKQLFNQVNIKVKAVQKRVSEWKKVYIIKKDEWF